ANVTKANMSEAFFMARDLATDHPDVVSGRRFRSANQCPEDLPGFRERLVEYCDALERPVQRLVRVYAPRARPSRHILRWALYGLPIHAARPPLPVGAGAA